MALLPAPVKNLPPSPNKAVLPILPPTKNCKPSQSPVPTPAASPSTVLAPSPKACSVPLPNPEIPATTKGLTTPIVKKETPTVPTTFPTSLETFLTVSKPYASSFNHVPKEVFSYISSKKLPT